MSSSSTSFIIPSGEPTYKTLLADSVFFPVPSLCWSFTGLSAEGESISSSNFGKLFDFDILEFFLCSNRFLILSSCFSMSF
jgi:hypothetical protein